MSFQTWLGEQAIGQFVDQYYGKLPHSGHGGGRSCHLGTLPVLGEILAQDDADVMVVRRGRQHSEQRPRSADDAQRLIDDGHTILVRRAERHHEGVSAMAAGFRTEFAAPVNVHFYATPGNEFGFGWHYDAEEVFILQTTGVKQYALRKNTVHPWPLEETIPADMQYERELMPLLKCTLAAGDWLYIPAGYWHKANVMSDETAMSLAVGVMAPAAIRVLDLLRGKLVSSLIWRQRLPTTGDASPLDDVELRDRFRALLSELSADLQRELTDEKFLDTLVAP